MDSLSLSDYLRNLWKYGEQLFQVICFAPEDVNTKNNQSFAFRSSSYIGYSAGNRAVYQKALPVLSNMADNPAISSLQLLTIVYCYFVATTRLHEPRSINCYPETTL